MFKFTDIPMKFRGKYKNLIICINTYIAKSITVITFMLDPREEKSTLTIKATNPPHIKAYYPIMNIFLNPNLFFLNF